MRHIIIAANIFYVKMILYDQIAYNTISFIFLCSTLSALVLFLCVHLGVHLPIIIMITISFCKLNTNILMWYASRVNDEGLIRLDSHQ